jgi:hypothetical protein
MKLVNINTVIYRLEQLIIEPLPIADCYEWIAAALQHIGGEYPQELKEKTLEIKDFRAELPCDLVNFLRLIEVKTPDNQSETFIEETRLPNYLETSYIYANKRVNFYDSTQQYNPFNNSIRHSVNSWLTPEDDLTWNSVLDYRIENSCMLFNLETGTIRIQYWAIPTDENELPMIPDTESYIEAFMWYCCKQLSYQGFKFKNQQFNLQFFEQKWNKYCLQARADGRMPDIHGMQRLANESMRLLPITNHYYTSFRYMGMMQHNNRHGRFR